MVNYTTKHSSSPRDALIVVAKRPAPGKTKTRLSPPLTSAQAARLYECFLQDSLDLARRVPETQPVVAFLPAQEESYFADLAPDFKRLLQVGDDLGSRLDNTLTFFLEQGCQRAVIMDSDSPTLPADYLELAFRLLATEADVVIGPCEDGGYYLIGMNHPAPRLLREVRMSTPSVTTDTLALAAKEGLKVCLLPTWYDVDDRDSLLKLLQDLSSAGPDTAQHTRAFFENLEMHELRDRLASFNQPISSSGWTG